MVEVSSITKLSKKFAHKRLSRLMAVQALYNAILTPPQENIDQIIFNLLRMYEQDKDLSFDKHSDSHLIKLARGAYQNTAELIAAIEPHLAEKWRFERLPKVVQAILLVACFELSNFRDLDKPIVINEYLEVAKFLEHSGEVGFINSVLDNFAKGLV